MSRAANLYQLQRLDTEEQEARRRLAEIAAALAETPALRQARQLALQTAERAQRCGIHQRDLELEVRGVKDELSATEERLYGGGVRNPKQLEELQAKAASLRRLLDRKEEELLEAMIDREEAEAAQEQARCRLEETRSGWEADQTNLRQEQAQLEARVVEIRQVRDRLLAAVSAADLDAYRALYRAKDGLAVAVLRAGACAACGMEVPPGQLERGREAGLLYCGNCERMLVPEKEVRP